MLNEILDIIHDLNEDKVFEAANKVLNLTKDIDDENLLKIASEIEKEIRSLKDDEELIYLIDKDYVNDMRRVIYDLKKARENKIKILIIQLIKKISKDNILVIEALKPKVEIKPHTFI